jgi:hypothetical protein
MPQFSDYLIQTLPNNTSLAATVGSFVQIVNNATSTAYVSTAATDANGKFTITAPAGAYTVSTGPTNAGPWTATGDTHYEVAPSDGHVASLTVDGAATFTAGPVTFSALGLGVAHLSALGLLSSSLIVDADVSAVGVAKLTGTTLPVGIVASSLTSVGVLAAPHMTSPVVDSGGLKLTGSLLDTNGNAILGLSPTAAAVDYLQITNAATGGIPGLFAVGADAYIPINFAAKGGDPLTPIFGFYGNGGLNQVFVMVNNYTGAGVSQTNYFEMDNAVTGVSPLLGLQGVDGATKIDMRFRPKGTGSFVFESDIAPRTTMFEIASTGAASVNYLQVAPNSTGNPAQLQAQGSDPNVGIYIAPKGTGGVWIASGGIKIGGLGAFAAGDKYVIAAADGTFHLSATGPAS